MKDNPTGTSCICTENIDKSFLKKVKKLFDLARKPEHLNEPTQKKHTDGIKVYTRTYFKG